MSIFDGIHIDAVLPGQYGLRLDPRVGLVMPWYTSGALDEIASWDCRGKTVFEWGGGYSTFWWSRAARAVRTVEANREWAEWIASTAAARGFNNIAVETRDPSDVDGYLKIPTGCAPDIVCVDASHQTKCIAVALELPRPLTLIVDNWQQDGVYIDADAERMMAPYAGKFFVQADHTAHQGRPWQTAIWRLT